MGQGDAGDWVHPYTGVVWSAGEDRPSLAVGPRFKFSAVLTWGKYSSDATHKNSKRYIKTRIKSLKRHESREGQREKEIKS